MNTEAKLTSHVHAAITRHRQRLALPRRVHVVVEVDPALAEGMTSRSVERLRRGVTLERSSEGVLLHGVPGLRGPLRVASMADAVMRLHDLADVQASMSGDAGGLATATGRYLHDRAALLREAARVCVTHRARLWPGESATA